MTKRSVFRDFIATLQKHWQVESPRVRPVKAGLGPLIPKASSFYAGYAPKLGMHVFVNLQHSSKAWQVGQFTANLVLSETYGAPAYSYGEFAPTDGEPFTEGSYRISDILGRRKDKWWHLKDDCAPIVTEAWRPSSYSNYQTVLDEAALDLSRDTREALARLGVEDIGLCADPA